jgi:predicted RecB family nuclease
MTTRYDVSMVPLQGGYVAKQCPVRAQNDVLRPSVPLPPSPVLERRFARGREFEAEIVASLLRLHPETVVVEAGDALESEAATTDAMLQNAPLILNSRLPNDLVGRRVGKPDLLIAASVRGYRPVDIKHHMSLEPSGSANALPVLSSELDLPTLEDAAIDTASAARRRKDDLLQLAHYQRMLEAADLAPADGRHAGIIGVERRVVWYDLDAPIWRTPSSSGSKKLRSTMEVYDFEFDFRLDIMAVAQSHVVDPPTELLVVPVRIGECDECPWWDDCRPRLEAGSGDVSLLPRVGWREWKTHRDHGVIDRATLAGLDITTARLVAAGIDVASLIDDASRLPPDTTIAELPGMRRRIAQLARLEIEGLSTVGDLAILSGMTASYSGAGVTSLPEQIDQARAALGPAPVYRRRGIDSISVPRADIEVDVDMENVEDGVYLWGALLTDRTDDSSPVHDYHPFVTWEPLTTQVAADNFLRFWNWLTELRCASQRAGRTFRAYCYNASAENTYLRSLGHVATVLDDVEEFIASDEWVDMLRVFDSQLITGGGSGLKSVAPLAGFSWKVDDPGGEESMLRYEVGVSISSEDEQEAAREWLLRYNRGDVEATLELRNWLDAESGSIPSIADVDPR